MLLADFFFCWNSYLSEMFGSESPHVEHFSVIAGLTDIIGKLLPVTHGVQPWHMCARLIRQSTHWKLKDLQDEMFDKCRSRQAGCACLHHKRATSRWEGIQTTYGRGTLRTPTTFGYMFCLLNAIQVLSRSRMQLNVFVKVCSCNNGRDGHRSQQLGCERGSGKDEENLWT